LHKPHEHRKEVFIPEYRDITIGYRDKKCALKASNEGNCWWVYQFLIYNPNRMVGRW
tara:strand:+ start:853 stop:1023 length:171 start_codon:yes stop_codon:yes gene_type:complete